MRNLDAIIIIYSTGEEAELVETQAKALEQKCQGRATWVCSFGTTGGCMPLSLKVPSTIPHGAKVGIYIVGHASSALGCEWASLWDHNMTDVVDLVRGVLGFFKSPDLQKLSLVACNLAAGATDKPLVLKDLPQKISSEAGSYVQHLCVLLARAGLTPKVAGWTGPLDVITSDWQVSKDQKGADHDNSSGAYIGKKTISMYGGSDDRARPVSYKQKYRNKHKFTYQVQNGSVAKLTLDEWHKNP